MLKNQTFHDRILSIWQSSINHVEQKRLSSLSKSGAPSMMNQFVTLVNAYNRSAKLPTKDDQGHIIDKCVKLVAELAWAEKTKNKERVTELTNELRMSTCDPDWLEVFEVYLGYRAKGGTIPYIRYKHLDDFIIPIPNKITIGFIADWGTGSTEAEWLLKEVMLHKPDLLIHLGDIYYSGTQQEVRENFLDLIRKHMGHTQVYTLSGNHDMYSGGTGYYWLLEQLNQPASYFCLRNNYWQFLAMDTGLHDSDPFSVSSNVTYLDPGEVTWHLDKFRTAGKRQTILLSHHQLFSALGVGEDGQGKQIGFNPHLLDAFRNHLDYVALWLWGHEHNLIVFDPYLELKNGRCIGAGAIPMLVEQKPYEPILNMNRQGLKEAPKMDLKKAKLSTNDDGFYYHTYAIMNLNNAESSVRYFQVDSKKHGTSQLLYAEFLTKKKNPPKRR